MNTVIAESQSIMWRCRFQLRHIEDVNMSFVIQTHETNLC